MLINKLIEASAALWAAYLNWSAALMGAADFLMTWLLPKTGAANWSVILPAWVIGGLVAIIWGARLLANNQCQSGDTIFMFTFLFIIGVFALPFFLVLIPIALAALLVAAPWLIALWFVFKVAYWYAKRNSCFNRWPK